MCGFCGQFCPSVLTNLLSCCRRAAKAGARANGNGKRGATVDPLLTPYELEQLPLMLRELEKANRHFWQMVCWRMAQQQRQKQEKLEKANAAGSAKKKASTTAMTSTTTATTMTTTETTTLLETEKRRRQFGEQPSEQRKSKGIDDSYADGCALRELVRALAKALCEKGTFDSVEADQLLANYRQRLLCEQWPPSSGGQGSPAGVPGKLADRRRDFAQRGRAISFNGGFASVGVAPTAGGKSSNSSNNSTTTGSSSSSSSGYSSEGMQQQQRQSLSGAKSRAASWLRQRAHSVRGRSARRCACQAQQRIAQLGELLNAEFYSTVYGHPEQFDVHERELKVLVWRRFSQLLVALLMDDENRNQLAGWSAERR